MSKPTVAEAKEWIRKANAAQTGWMTLSEVAEKLGVQREFLLQCEELVKEDELGPEDELERII